MCQPICQVLPPTSSRFTVERKTSEQSIPTQYIKILSFKTIYFSDGSLVNREKGKITTVKQMSGPTNGQRSVLGVHWHENRLADSLIFQIISPASISCSSKIQSEDTESDGLGKPT